MEASTRGLLFASIVALGLAAASRVRAEDAGTAGDLRVDLGGEVLELRRIPKGTFTQGSPDTEAGRESDETARLVAITRAFWMGAHPVTRAQFARFVTETRHVTEAEKGGPGKASWRSPGFAQTEADPVVLVTFGDANAFVAWVARKIGQRARLPTEAEWEYAARAGTQTPWYAGTTKEDALASGWLAPNAGKGTHPVGKKPPNAFGLFDMTGNVFEWCRDVYAPIAPGRAVDPENVTTESEGFERRVLRGGSWRSEPRRARSAARRAAAPGTRSVEVGFRVVVVDDDAMGLGPDPAAPVDPFVNPVPPVGLSASPPSSPGGEAEGSPERSPSPESRTWPLVAAPLAAAALVLAWIFARRRKVR